MYPLKCLTCTLQCLVIVRVTHHSYLALHGLQTVMDGERNFKYENHKYKSSILQLSEICKDAWE